MSFYLPKTYLTPCLLILSLPTPLLLWNYLPSCGICTSVTEYVYVYGWKRPYQDMCMCNTWQESQLTQSVVERVQSYRNSLVRRHQHWILYAFFKKKTDLLTIHMPWSSSIKWVQVNGVCLVYSQSYKFITTNFRTFYHPLKKTLASLPTTSLRQLPIHFLSL